MNVCHSENHEKCQAQDKAAQSSEVVVTRLDTIKKILPSVILHLHQEAAQKNDPQAHGLLKIAENWQFLAVLNLMYDTLPHLSSFSRYFQVTFSPTVYIWGGAK